MHLIKSKRIGRISTTVIVLMCGLLVSGCDRSPKAQKTETKPATPAVPGAQAVPAAKMDPATQSNAGKYIRKNSPNDYTELKSDGTFLIFQSDYKGNGSYKIDGKRLFLTLKPGVVVEGTIVNKTITDNRGNIWEKQ